MTIVAAGSCDFRSDPLTKVQTLRRCCSVAMLWIVSLVFAGDVLAHGDMDWNDFTIDNKNNSVEVSLQQVRKLIGDLVLDRRPVPTWPDPDLLRVKAELLDLQEEMDDLLNHFGEDKINIRLPSSLRQHPRAGRSVAASHAIEVAVDLLSHIARSDGPESFEEELHEGGIGSYMFDLMESYADMMSLYGALPGDPDGQAKDLTQ